MPTALRNRVLELQGPKARPPLGLNEREIADELNGDPRFAKRSWDTSAVRRTIKAIRAEQREFLHRISTIVVEIPRQGTSRAEFNRLCVAHRFDWFWLWDRFAPAFERGELDADCDLRPPVRVDHAADRVTVTPAGQRIVSHWNHVEPYSDEALDVVAVMAVHRLEGAQVPRLCRRYHAKLDELVSTGLLHGGGTPTGLTLTDKGHETAGQWAIANTHAGHVGVWQRCYWPSPAEEATLPTNWDWQHRPLTP